MQQIEVRNDPVFERIRRRFNPDQQRKAQPGALRIEDAIRLGINLNDIKTYPEINRFYLQQTGHYSHGWGNWKNKKIGIPTPIAADDLGATSSVSGTTTSVTEAQIIAWSSAAFNVAPDFLDRPRIKGRPRFTGLFGVVSDNAAGTATITKVEAVITGFDDNNILQQNLCWQTSPAISLQADGAAGTTEVKNSVTLIFDPVDIELLNPAWHLGIQVAVWGTTGNVAHTTTAKLYTSPGSNDSYIDIPFA